MSVPVGQMLAVLRHIAVQRLRGNSRYPLVLMLEPLFRCNLACGGCGKIQHPAEILRSHLPPERCFAAVDECGAPIVSIPGGEPLLHPQIVEIVEGIVARRKYLYLCTNALKLEEMLPRFRPSPYLAFSVHLDGPQVEHDHAVCRAGVYDVAVSAIRAARRAGFRVTTNSTLFTDADPQRHRAFFDDVMALGVEGMMISPGYPYAKAPDQDHFLPRRGRGGRGSRLRQVEVERSLVAGKLRGAHEEDREDEDHIDHRREIRRGILILRETHERHGITPRDAGSRRAPPARSRRSPADRSRRDASRAGPRGR